MLIIPTHITPYLQKLLCNMPFTWDIIVRKIHNVIQPISSHPLNNTPVRNDNTRSLLQEATSTRYVIISTLALFCSLSLRDDSDFYIWPDDRVKVLEYISSNSWFLNIYMTPSNPPLPSKYTHPLIGVLLCIYETLNPKTYFNILYYFTHLFLCDIRKRCNIVQF
jgi:hypothetical protein